MHRLLPLPAMTTSPTGCSLSISIAAEASRRIRQSTVPRRRHRADRLPGLPSLYPGPVKRRPRHEHRPPRRLGHDRPRRESRRPHHHGHGRHHPLRRRTHHRISQPRTEKRATTHRHPATGGIPLREAPNPPQTVGTHARGQDGTSAYRAIPRMPPGSSTSS